MTQGDSPDFFLCVAPSSSSLFCFANFSCLSLHKFVSPQLSKATMFCLASLSLHYSLESTSKELAGVIIGLTMFVSRSLICSFKTVRLLCGE